ncbi:Saccharopine dehydrogenase (NADP(+), L-glutamate-forming) [Handroanthus impetiginosus]|uniref:Saccharopine dehydrogenase (NADP(+), L-glutamate-forming) n=1 Tax=Handroanthus impetiginosus TaxID=429701 RepID=A0A2G9H4X7_9LAMI|nr:Saccharopine dehydrogenase (NADP(+), L-glutamate-forming) [Handroanthus impetiginosus]
MARFCLQLNTGSSRNLAMALAAETGQRKSGTVIERVEVPQKVKNSRILILGGTGRVGGSTAVALSKFCPDLRIIIGGRNRDKGAAMVNKLGKNAKFSEVDINDSKSLEEAMKDVDLVVHTAGPFQQAKKCTVLEAAIQNKTAYLEVCDDTSYAQRAKSYMRKALDANVPAITSGGIYPGVSNVMAAELVRAATSEGKGEPQRLRFYYYTAGSGGAGPTILSTSFLLLGEEVVAYNKGEKIKLKPYSGMLNIDFGQGIGKKDVFLLNLPEVRSIHEVLGVPTVSARFGTAPFFWNWGMAAMTYLLPAETLRDRSKVQQLVQSFDPLVRAVDGLVGEKVSMRNVLSIAAFVLAILEGSTQPGVWFPEEPEGISIEARETLLSRASQGTINFIMNKAPWMVETDPKEIGFGIYD